MLNTEKKGKKRGRKPKIKTDEEQQKVLKKRGRKPMTKFNIEKNMESYETIAQQINNNIIKIPIEYLEEENNEIGNFEIFNDISKTKSIDDINNKYNAECEFYEKSKEFEQTVKSLLYDYFNNKNDSNNKDKYVNVLKSLIDNIDNIELDNEEDINNNHNLEYNNYKVNNDYFYYQQKKTELFNDLNDDNMKQIEILINKKYRHTKYISLMKTIVDYVDTNKEWVKKTDIACHNCCHEFDFVPWGVPVSYKNDKFNLTGIFCTPNCAMSYLLDNEKDQHLLHERISLLNFMHYLVFKNDDNITPAPNRIILKKFGGPLNIDEYRYLTLKNNKNYDIILPPCNVIAPIVEETKKLTDQYNYFIPKDKTKIKKTNAELKIKRRSTKPTNINPNSIFNLINQNN